MTPKNPIIVCARADRCGREEGGVAFNETPYSPQMTPLRRAVVAAGRPPEMGDGGVEGWVGVENSGLSLDLSVSSKTSIAECTCRPTEGGVGVGVWWASGSGVSMWSHTLSGSCFHTWERKAGEINTHVLALNTKYKFQPRLKCKARTKNVVSLKICS